MKEIIMDEPFAALVYAAQRNHTPHMALLEQMGAKYGEYINIVALIVDDPATVKKEFKGKLPLFRYYKNELKGQAKRDSSFEILIPERLSVENDLEEIGERIAAEMEDNFEHDVKIVTEKVYYPSARQVTQQEHKHALAWLYASGESNIPFVYKALSKDPVMKDHFVFFAIDSPDSSLTGGNPLPCLQGMLEINEENPSPRVFNLEGDKIMASYESSVLSLVSQIVPERKDDVVKQFEARKKDRKKTEKP